MRHNGVTTAPAIRLVEAFGGLSGLALAVEAARDIVQGEHLCTIPKAACISIRTTELADIIQAEQLGGGALYLGPKCLLLRRGK